MLRIGLNSMEYENHRKKISNILIPNDSTTWRWVQRNESSFGFVIKPPNARAIVVGWAAKSSNRYTWPLLFETWRSETEKHWLQKRMNENMQHSRWKRQAENEFTEYTTQHNTAKQPNQANANANGMREKIRHKKKRWLKRRKTNEKKKQTEIEIYGCRGHNSIKVYMRLLLLCDTFASFCFVAITRRCILCVLFGDFIFRCFLCVRFFFLHLSSFVCSFVCFISYSLSHTNHHLTIYITIQSVPGGIN